MTTEPVAELSSDPSTDLAAGGNLDARRADRAKDRTDDGTDQDGGIHFHFPIDISVIGGSDDELVDQVVERVFDQLRRELERRA